MKQIVKLGMCVAILLVLFACKSFRANTKAPTLPDNEVRTLNIKQPVAFSNVSSQSGDITLGKWLGAKAVGDLYEFTESSIGAAKNIFERQGIEVTSSANKILELSVYDAKVKQGMVMFEVKATLRVRTGDGLIKEYVGVKKFGNAYATSPAVERALAQCVMQMLNDKDILEYLEN